MVAGCAAKRESLAAFRVKSVRDGFYADTRLARSRNILGGMLAGGAVDRVIVGGPAWHELGAPAWASIAATLVPPSGFKALRPRGRRRGPRTGYHDYRSPVVA
jgi:hypothetical protein